MKYRRFNNWWSSYRSRPKLANVIEKRKLPEKLRKNERMTVYEKILAVKRSIKTVPKSGSLEVNGKKQYDFARDVDVLAMLNELTNAEGLIIAASQESSEIGYFEVTNQYGTRTQRSAKVRMRFEIIDVDDPADSVVSYFDGYAEDTSDKPLTKATTSACKYFMLKFFGIPTGDDLEADASVHEPTSMKVKKAKPVEAAGAPETPLAKARREFEEQQRAKGAM